ncbi:MAG: cupin domain-containing protein [Chitinophagales bacterium]
MNIEEYILSGILEQYCLGLTSEAENKELQTLCLKHKKLQKELDSVQQTLGNYANNHAMLPKSQLKNNILYAIDELDFVEQPIKQPNEKINLQNPPLIHQNSNHQQWLKAVQDLQPVAIQEGFPVFPIRIDEKVQMVVVWIDKGVPDEQHEMESESFLILEGSCVCQVGKASHPLKAGDFLGIPTYTNHSLKVTSATPVKLIVQRVQLVA